MYLHNTNTMINYKHQEVKGYEESKTKHNRMDSCDSNFAHSNRNYPRSTTKV